MSTRTAPSMPQPGTHPEITFQRERVFRRQTVDDAIAEALANQLRFCARDIARRIGHEFALAFGVAKEKGIACMLGPQLARCDAHTADGIKDRLAVTLRAVTVHILGPSSG